MLNRQMTRSFFVLLISLLPILSFGQCKDWVDKISIITKDNDTIVGLHKDMDYTYSLINSLDYKDENCSKHKVRINQVKYVLHGPDKFEVKSTMLGFALLRLALDNGGIKYYTGTYTQKANNTFGTDHLNAGNPMNTGHYFPEKEVIYHYILKDKVLHKIKSKRKPFSSKMKKLFGDCPEIKKKIKAKEYLFMDLYTIVRKYSEWVEKEKKETLPK